MRPVPEHQPVLRRFLGVAADPSIRVKRVGFRKDRRIVQGGPHRRHDHRAFGRREARGDGEVLLHHVRHHDHGWSIAQGLLDHGARERHVFQDVHAEPPVAVPAPRGEVLRADPVQNLRSVRHQLKEPGRGAAGGILRGEQEREQGHGDLQIGKFSQQHRRLFDVRGPDPGHLLPVHFRIMHVLHPAVQDAGDFPARRDAGLALRGAFGEFVQDHVGRLLAVPRPGERKDPREIHEVQGRSDLIKVIGNLFDRAVRHVMPHEGSQRHRAHEFSKHRHKRDRLARVVGLRNLDEHGEILVIHVLLARQVYLQCLAGEQAVQPFPVIDVGFAVQEYPVVRPQQLMRYIDDAWLDVGRRVEHFARHLG